MSSNAKSSSKAAKTRGKRSNSVTLRTVADHVKLSPATISIVLNRSPVAKSIPAETQERIFKAAKELNYRPNYLARSLRNRRSMSVGVLVPEVIGGYAVGVLGGLEEQLKENEYFYLIAAHGSRKELLKKYVDLLVDRSVEGFVLIATPIEEPLDLPTVSVAGHLPLEGMTNVVIDHHGAIRAAMAHLVELGHRDIAFFKGHPGSADTEERWQAVCQAAEEFDITIRPELSPQLSGGGGQTFSPQQGYEEGYAFGKHLLDAGGRFTALMAFNDVSAIGAMRAFLDAGHKIPHDISVVGFDDIESAAFHNPGLTTIRQPLADMGRIAGRTLLQHLAGKGNLEPFIHVDPELVVRGTTAPPRRS